MTSNRLVVDGRFEMLFKLGAGGMGSVWLAEDRRLGRAVALKELVPGHDAEGLRTARKRAVREAEALAKLRHPVIVRVYDLFFIDGNPWIVMEHIDGRSVESLIRDCPLDEIMAAKIGLQVARGLAAAHRAGVVHRDVKPDNILVTAENVIYLVDFGIARMAGVESLTSVNSVVGTPQYVSPERLRGDRTDGPAADLWSLGVTLYYALTGQRPFGDPDRDSSYAIQRAVMNAEPPRLACLGSLTDLVFRMLDKAPDSRAGTAEVITALTAFLRKSKAAAQRSPDDMPIPVRQAVPSPRPTPAPRTDSLSRPSPRPRPGGPAPSRNGSGLPGRVAEVRALISSVGPDTGAAMLLSIPARDAASILAALPQSDRTQLIQGITNIRPAASAAILQFLDPAQAASSADELGPESAAAIFAAMAADKAVPIMDRMDVRYAGWLVRYLPVPHAVLLFKAMDSQRAAAILSHAKQSAAAAVLGADPPLETTALRHIPEPDRHQISRLIASRLRTPTN